MSTEERIKDDLNMGLTWHGHSLAWGFRSGFGRTWLPRWFKHLIVECWNWPSCRILGHSWMPDFDELKTVLQEDDEGILYDWSEVKHRICGNCSKRERLYTLP